MSGEIEKLVEEARGFAKHLREAHGWDDDAEFVDRLADALSRPAWTEEQVEAAAKVFINERHRMGIIAPKWEAWTDEERRCQVEAMRAALASLAQTDGGAG